MGFLFILAFKAASLIYFLEEVVDDGMLALRGEDGDTDTAVIGRSPLLVSRINLGWWMYLPTAESLRIHWVVQMFIALDVIMTMA